MKTDIIIEINRDTALFFANRFRIHQSTGGKMKYGEYVGNFVDNLIDEIEEKK